MNDQEQRVCEKILEKILGAVTGMDIQQTDSMVGQYKTFMEAVAIRKSVEMMAPQQPH